MITHHAGLGEVHPAAHVGPARVAQPWWGLAVLGHQGRDEDTLAAALGTGLPL